MSLSRKASDMQLILGKAVEYDPDDETPPQKAPFCPIRNVTDDRR